METWTIATIKKANIAAGRNWFEPGTMRFFNTRCLPTVYQGPGGIYFVTSEVAPSGEKAYTVRQFVPEHGRIETVGEFHVIRDKNTALAAARALAARTPEQNDCNGTGPHTPGEVRAMPCGGGANAILCRRCWENELAFREERNKNVFCKFDLPKWEKGEVYDGSR